MMFREWMRVAAAVLCATAAQPAQGQQFTTSEIEWENGVNYFADTADLSKLAASPGAVNPRIRNFMHGTAIADIVSVNGKPAKGSWVGRAQLVMLVPNPAAGTFTSRFFKTTERVLARSSVSETTSAPADHSKSR